MSTIALERAFEKYPNVKAVLVVHLYGLSANMDKLVELCKKHNVSLIEDAAESLGTYYKGKHTGTFGDYGIFSFNGNKIITTSGGGMLVSNNEERISKVRFWATQSRDAARHYQHSEIGFNYRMSNVIAGIGRGQLKVLDERIEKKNYIYEFYKRELEQLEGLKMMPVNEWSKSNCWLSCITLNGQVKPLDIMLALEKENIESRPIWKPMHMQPVFDKYDFIPHYEVDVRELVAASKDESLSEDVEPGYIRALSVSEDIFNRGVCLPSDTKMSDEDLNRVCEIIKGLWM
jgi:dTDP-4-amino-4,6-dideoxygalactose transaminase